DYYCLIFYNNSWVF
nr:immunoglobulin light chain junction region [Macaca mulatta]MOY07661.1 immunoglobulin light chain junction region [Macaca mulatta]